MRAKIFIGLSVALLALLVVTASLSQSVPELINYQGRLTDSAGAPLDGVTVDLTFAFYGVGSGGTAYLSVLQEDVLVTGGLYNVTIGSGTIIPGTESTLADVFEKHPDVWMGVKVNTDPEMTQRQKVTSVPFTFYVDPNAVLRAVWHNPDPDGDNYKSVLVGGLDCDDDDPGINPGAAEVFCDGIDQDCDGFDHTSNKIGNDHRISSDSRIDWRPSLAWSGSEFGVSWEGRRGGYSEIFFSRVSASGDTVGSDLRVTYDAGAFYPSLAWTGSEFGVSWQDNRTGTNHIFFSRVSAAGDTIGSNQQITLTGANDNPSLVWTGSEFGVSWDSNRDGNFEIYSALISATGVKVSPDIRVTSAEGVSSNSSLSWAGSGYGVSWEDNRNGPFEICFARLLATGFKIGSDLRVTTAANNKEDPSLTWTGSEFGLSWIDWPANDIYFTRISAAGTKIGSDLRVTRDAGNNLSPSLAWTGSEFGVSWWDNRNGNDEIYFASISANGTKTGPDLRITSDPATSRYPSLSWTGSEFGVSWEDFRDDDNDSCDTTCNWEIYFARIGVCP